MKDKRKLPKSHTFNGRKYRIVWKKPYKAQGLCDAPNVPDKVMQINPNNTPEEVCNTVIHEALHAELWDLDEAAVDRIAYSISELLDKCGLIAKTP